MATCLAQAAIYVVSGVRMSGLRQGQFSLWEMMIVVTLLATCFALLPPTPAGAVGALVFSVYVRRTVWGIVVSSDIRIEEHPCTLELHRSHSRVFLDVASIIGFLIPPIAVVLVGADLSFPVAAALAVALPLPLWTALFYVLWRLRDLRTYFVLDRERDELRRGTRRQCPLSEIVRVEVAPMSFLYQKAAFDVRIFRLSGDYFSVTPLESVYFSDSAMAEAAGARLAGFLGVPCKSRSPLAEVG